MAWMATAAACPAASQSATALCRGALKLARRPLVLMDCPLLIGTITTCQGLELHSTVRARLPGFHTCVGTGGDRQTPDWYAEKGISFISGKASGIDLEKKLVSIGEEQLQYNKLILATGCRAVKLGSFGVKGDDMENVFYLREEQDAAKLVSSLEKGKTKALVAGGGYLGLECAAALVGWGVANAQ
eukprot:s729_g18.t1